MILILLTIDLEKDIPIYTQIRNEVIKALATGELTAGDSLPSVRSLAADLGVNMHTINKAYNILKGEGFLIVNRRKGVVVNKAENFKATIDYYKNLEEQLQPILNEAQCRGMTKKEIISTINKMMKMEGDL